MNIIVLFFGHLVCFSISTIFRLIIKRYIGSKPPGHQSVLDLLLLDIMFLQTFLYINFLIVLLTGLIGHMPFIASQIMLSFVMIPHVMSTCLSQFFIVCKAILVFRGIWLADLSDLSVKRMLIDCKKNHQTRFPSNPIWCLYIKVSSVMIRWPMRWTWRLTRWPTWYWIWWIKMDKDG